MSLELFIAGIVISASFSVLACLWTLRRINRLPRGTPDELASGATAIESRFSDLISELNHVANSHVNAVEDRRDELRRVIEMANGRVRRLVSLLSDLEIIEKRLRGSVAGETIVEDVAAPRATLSKVVDAETGASGFSRLSRLPQEGAELTRVEHARVDHPRGESRRGELHRQIREKASEGLSPAVIASTLRVQQNEVEMILRKEKRH